MTLDEILASLFPAGHSVRAADGLLWGKGALGGTERVHVLGISEGVPLGVEGALALAGKVLGVMRAADRAPILALIDSSSQRMSRHDELLGLNECLAHLAKTLLLAHAEGWRTIGLLYGGSAAGAFIATALSCDTLLALPGAHPVVMDLPSMARVTKLPIETLQEMAKATSVFAPGLEPLAATGAIGETLDPTLSLADQVLVCLRTPVSDNDERGRLGAERGGRQKAALLAARIETLASA